MTLITWFDIPWSEELWSKIFQEWAEAYATCLWFKSTNVELYGAAYMQAWTYVHLAANEENWEILRFYVLSPIYSLPILDPNLASAMLEYGVGRAGVEGVKLVARSYRRVIHLHCMWQVPNDLDIELNTSDYYLYILYHFSRWSSIERYVALPRLVPALLL